MVDTRGQIPPGPGEPSLLTNDLSCVCCAVKGPQRERGGFVLLLSHPAMEAEEVKQALCLLQEHLNTVLQGHKGARSLCCSV